MIASIALITFVRSTGFSFRAIEAPLSIAFRSLPHEQTATNRLLLANGKSTGIVFPPNLKPYTAGRLSNGKPVGGLQGQFSGAYSGQTSVIVLPKGKGYAVVQPLKNFANASLTAVDKKGRLLGIAFNSAPPNIDDPFRDLSHGFLISNARTNDLGSASTVRFGTHRSILGEFLADHSGRPISTIVDGDGYYFKFIWKDGARHLLPGKRKAQE